MPGSPHIGAKRKAAGALNASASTRHSSAAKPRRMNPLHHRPLRHLLNQYRRGYVSMISLHGQRSWVTLR